MTTDEIEVPPRPLYGEQLILLYHPTSGTCTWVQSADAREAMASEADVYEILEWPPTLKNRPERGQPLDRPGGRRSTYRGASIGLADGGPIAALQAEGKPSRRPRPAPHSE